MSKRRGRGFTAPPAPHPIGHRWRFALAALSIAEEDLRLRGAGEILGTRQSGEAEFRLAGPERTAALIDAATQDARLLVDRDGGLEGERGKAARTALYLFERDAAVGLLRAG